MKTIGIYPRKSVYRDNSDSVQVQVQLCKEYCQIIYKDDELNFITYDKDEGFSGKNMNRPSFREMMHDVKSGLLNAVIVYKLDRISRNVQEFSSMYEIFLQHNVSFISVKESFDTSTPMGRTVMYILAAFAQLERENTSERVADSMKVLGASGKWTGGKLPTGMTSERRICGNKEHSYLLVDNDSIWLVKLLFDLILNGYPITRVERYCRDNGIKSQSGKYLNTSQIYNIVTNPVYCQNTPEAYYYFLELGCHVPDASLFDGKYGLIGYGKTKTCATSQKKQNTTNWSIGIGIHDSVISSADWIAAQKRFSVNKQVRTAKYEIGILKGVLKCSCGSRMDARVYIKNNRIFAYYYCSRMGRQGRSACDTGYTKVSDLEDVFIKQLRKIRLNPDSFKIRTDIISDLNNASHIRTELKKLEESIGNLTSALSQAMDTPAAGYIINQISDLDKQKKRLESNLRSVLYLESAQKSIAEERDEIYKSICYLLDNFNNINYTGKNELIRKIIKECIFDGKNLRIIF